MNAAEIQLVGAFRDTSFPDWICHRAQLLDLDGWVTAPTVDEICVVVAGPQALIDAMEMACSLGPMDVRVDRIKVRPTLINDPLNGFQKL